MTSTCTFIMRAGSQSVLLMLFALFAFSQSRTITGKVTAVGQTLSGLVVGDEVIKAALAISTYAEMEISSYRILVAAAKTCGATEAAALCERLLNEKMEFHHWIEQQLPTLTEEYLRREEMASGSAAP